MLLERWCTRSPRDIGRGAKCSTTTLAINDYKIVGDAVEIYINDGNTKIDPDFDAYLDHLSTLKVGEVYLNSIDRDGTGFGYDFTLVERFRERLNVPLIFAGGAGNEKHFEEGLNYEQISAVATANLFN
ncbi:MAG: hypothetical protein EOO61_16630, partial [Hymenobacter sp.]